MTRLGIVLAVLAFCAAIVTPLAPISAATTLKLGPSNNGLVGWWKFDEGTGTRATDSSGSGKTGTLVSSPTWVAGKLGGAINFNGSTNYVSASSFPALSAGAPFTISAWVYLASGAGSFPMIVDANTSSSAWFFGVNIGSGSHAGLNLYLGSGTMQTTNNTAFTTNTWHHVVGTYDGSVAKVYVDNVLLSTSSSGTSAAKLSGLLVGNGTAAGNSFWKGNIDDLRIYNRALSAAEVLALYNTGAANFQSSTGLNNGTSLNSGFAGWWTFDGKDTNWATMKETDESGQGNTGTLVNLATTTAPVIGKLGQAIKFNGTSSTLSIGSPSSLNLSGAVTLSIWLKGSSASGTQLAFGNWISSSSLNFGLFWSDSGSSHTTKGLECLAGNAGFSGLASNAYADGKWHHVVCTWDGTSVSTLYVDGALIDQRTNASSISNPTRAWQIGSGNNQWFFPGSADDARIYNRALSAAEVKQLYLLGGATPNAPTPTTQNGGSLTSGLVGLWTFDGKDTKWNSNTEVDESGSGNTGTFVGMSTTTSPTIGKMGQAMYFPGSAASFLSIPNSASLGPTASITIAAWVKMKNISANTNEIVQKQNSYGLKVTSAGKVVGYRWGGPETHASATTLVNNKWYFIAMTYDSATHKTYVNGVMENSEADVSSIPSSSTVVRIGSAVASGQTNGTIDDARVYNRALSAAEVKQLYLLGK
jgi:hypothetical protein